MAVSNLTQSTTSVSAIAESRGTTERALLVVYQNESARVVSLDDGATVTVGRGVGTEISVDSDRVSRMHAQFQRRGNLVWLEDLGSRNGTHVNGESIAQCALTSGDEVEIGPAKIVVSIATRVHERPRIEGIRHLSERLAAEVDRGHRYHRVFALVMLRVDSTPADADVAIDRVAARLHPAEMVAEYSSLEFAIVLPEIDGELARETAGKLADAARGDEHLAVSVGVATFPQHGTTPDALIARARGALASALQLGEQSVGSPPEDATASGSEVLVKDPQMERVYDLARKVATHPITVLIIGETGVGKEVVAAAIHAASARSGPLIRLNCASLPETLLESELFGHEKGAFTGADRRKHGYFQAAHGGTLFLDEIGELSPGMQSKLLRVLEQRRIIRVGGTEEIEVDVRVVCATNRDLNVEVQRNTFRSDLFYRISAFTIVVPPLRDRPGEILMLAEHFIERAVEAGKRPPRLAQEAAEALRGYTWPGNVRELRNAIERAVVLHSRGVIELADLPGGVRDARFSSSSPPPEEWRTVVDAVASVERAAIAAALAAANGNQTEAAKRLGVSRRTLIYRMEKYGFKALPRSRLE
jgi:two-component system, NtrC family, response regulator AtoC